MGGLTFGPWAVSTIDGGGTTPTTGSINSPTYSTETDATNSPIVDGLLSWTITNIGIANGLVGGESIPPGTSVSSMQPFYDGRTNTFRLPDGVAFDATGTTFLIEQITD